MNIIPFKFEGSHSVRVVEDDGGEPWFVAKDVADVLGYSDAFEMTKRLDDDEKQNRQIAGFGPRGVTLINEPGLYAAVMGSSKPEAKPFKRWVKHDVLPTIRKTGSYTVKPAAAIKPVEDACRLLPTMVRAARACGLDKNAAAISANQAVAKLTGANVMQLLGHTHMEAEQQVRFFTPTELGERMNLSGRKLNMLLADAGLQAKKNDVWVPLSAAEGFFRLFDTGKRHGDGTPVQQLKWAEGVLPLIQPEKDPA